MKKLPDFEMWIIQDLSCLKEVVKLINTPLSDNNTVLLKQLSMIEAWYSRVTTLLADANSYLDKAIAKQLINIKKQDYIAIERKAIADKAVRGERRIRDIIQGYVDAIKQRISLGQSLLRMQYEEKHFGNKYSA